MSRIREIRKEKGMTGVEIAKRLNITPTYYYEIERGKKRLSADIAVELAKIFNVSADYLLGLDNEINNQNEIPHWATKKDIRDFKKMLEEDVPVMFDGIPLDEEDKEKVLRVMEAIFWDAKRKNKRKRAHKRE